METSDKEDMIILPFIGVVTGTLSTVYSRWILRTFRLQPAPAIVIGFALSATLMFGLSLWFGSIDARFITFTPLLFFVISVGLGLSANIYSLAGLKKDSLRNYELIEVMAPFITMALAALVFRDEREPVRLAIGLFAAASFALTHIERKHLTFSRVDRWLLLSVVLFSLETLFVKPILHFLAPVTFYGLRAGVIALVTLIIFRPSLIVPKQVWNHSLLNTLIAGIRSIAVLYSITFLGIVNTQLVLLAEPIFMALISRLGYQEPWNFRQGLGFIAIVISIGLVHFLTG